MPKENLEKAKKTPGSNSNQCRKVFASLVEKEFSECLQFYSHLQLLYFELLFFMGECKQCTPAADNGGVEEISFRPLVLSNYLPSVLPSHYIVKGSQQWERRTMAAETTAVILVEFLFIRLLLTPMNNLLSSNY